MRILITGGSRGIGAECVRRFAAEGNVVSFIYNNSDGQAGELSRETGALPIKADVSDLNALKLAVTVAAAKMGGVDVLVNNAGVSLIKLFTDVSDEELQRVFNVNLMGASVAAREVAKIMVKEHFGRIINIGSVWGRVGASCEVVYSASKAGLEGLTRALAKELGPSGITVNCIEPGVIDTEMNSELDEEALCALCAKVCNNVARIVIRAAYCAVEKINYLNLLANLEAH